MSEALRVGVLLGDGLAASVWTSGLSNAHRAARTLKSGTVGVNNHDGSDLTVPFGGVKQSSSNRHDKTLHALDKYSTLKFSWMALKPRRAGHDWPHTQTMTHTISCTPPTGAPITGSGR